MCEPMTAAAIMGGLAVTSSAASMYAQKESAEASMKASAAEAVMNNLQAQNQYESINQQASHQLTENTREAMRERSRLLVAQAESGLTGASPLRDIANTYMQESLQAGSIKAATEADMFQASMGAQATNLQSLNASNTAKSSVATGWNAGLQIAAGGASGAMQGYYMGKSAKKS